jgi:hypothetical protein
VGAGSVDQLDDAVASLDVVLTDADVRELEAAYTPRYDFQGFGRSRTGRDPGAFPAWR